MTRAAVVVADDLTGTVDTVHGFAARGHEAAVIVHPTAADQGDLRDSACEILGVNTDTRYVDAGAAARGVAETIRRVPADVVYKKVDSTLRGNPGAETGAALAASGAAFALVAPAFPATGRTTIDGVHRVDGTPVAETEYANDEKGPTSSRVSELFAGVDRSVGSIPIGVVEAGTERVASEITDHLDRADRPPILVCDARTSADLATIAAAGSRFDAVYAGSGGLAKHVDVPASADDGPPTLPEPEVGAPLGIVGSVNRTTLDQLARVPDEHVVELDPVTLLTDPTDGAAATRASDRLRAGLPVALTAARDLGDVDRTVAAGRDMDLERSEVVERVATGLGETAAVAAAGGPSGLLYTGGDVALAGLEALDVTTIELTGASVSSGVPVGVIADGDAVGTPVVTKAGGFGTTDTIVDCLGTLTRNQ